MAVQDYELLLRVRADLQQALHGMDGLSNSLGEVDKQARAAGESADQASARISAMVAATAKQAQVQESFRSQQERAAEAIRGTLNAYDQQRATVDRTRAAVEAYRTSVGKNAEASAAIATTRLQAAEMAKLAAQIDPAVAALDKLDKQEAALRKLYAAGAVGAEDFAKFSGVIENNRMALTRAGQAMHTFSLNSSMARRELGRLAGDIANGNWGRFEQTSLTLANYTGLMSAAFSPLGLAIIATTGAIAAFAVAANDAAAGQNAFNKAIQETGNFAGVTSSDLEQMAQRITPANGSLSNSRKILEQLAASGRVSGAALESLGKAAADMAQLTGESSDKAAAAVLKMFDGTAASAAKANDQYHFLTTSIYDQIKALEDQGQTQQAIDVAAQAFHDAATKRLQAEHDQIRGLAAVWDSVKEAVGRYYERFKTGAALIAGTADLQTQIYAMEGQKAGAQSGNPFTFASWKPSDEQKLADLRAQLAKQQAGAADTGTKQHLDSAAVDADAGLDRLSASVDRAYERKAKIQELNKYFNDLWAGADPNNAKLQGVQRVVGANGEASFSGGLYDTLLADIDKKYADRKGPSTAGKEAAAKAAQEQLIKGLGDEQGALDPVVRIWARYNDAVTKANDLAAKAKTSKNADVQAINAQRDAYVAAAAQVRDAALDNQAKKDRQEFESLAGSLKDLDGVRLGNVQAQIAKLDDLLKRGVISSGEYKDTVEAALDKGFKKLPEYSGVDAVVGGPFSEVLKLNDAEKKLQDAYKEELALLDKQHELKLRSEESYLQKRDDLQAKYAVQQAKIDQARQVLTLKSSSEFFGQLSQLQQSSNRKIATIGKAAAIAKAMIDTYQSATAAYASLASIPYIGPALGAAAAAAAVAAGLANVAAIRAQPIGFARGGRISGPGSGTSDSIIARVSDGENVITAAATDFYGQDFMDAINNMQFPRAAGDGRLLEGLASTAGFGGGRQEPALPVSLTTTGRPAAGPGAAQKHVHVWDRNQAAQEIASTDAFEEAVLHVVGNNPTAIRGRWGHP